MFSKPDSLDSRESGNDDAQLVTSVHGAVRMEWYYHRREHGTPRRDTDVLRAVPARTREQVPHVAITHEAKPLMLELGPKSVVPR